MPARALWEDADQNYYYGLANNKLQIPKANRVGSVSYYPLNAKHRGHVNENEIRSRD